MASNSYLIRTQFRLGRVSLPANVHLVSHHRHHYLKLYKPRFIDDLLLFVRQPVYPSYDVFSIDNIAQCLSSTLLGNAAPNLPKSLD